MLFSQRYTSFASFWFFSEKSFVSEDLPGSVSKIL
jgi:hypothetical protein